jgi:hypothetical protein
VYGTIMCVSSRQLIAVLFLCIKFLNTLMLKWLLRLLRLYKLSRCHMALNCSCVFCPSDRLKHVVMLTNPVAINLDLEAG